MITRIIRGERAPGDRIRQLVELGVPEELLPAPNRRSPGRPRLLPAIEESRGGTPK